MIGTQKSEMSILLKLAIAGCILFSMKHLIEFGYTRVPPYSVGTCLSTPNPMFPVKVDENHVIKGYSLVTIDAIVQKLQGPISFTELRDSGFKPIECDK